MKQSLPSTKFRSYIVSLAILILVGGVGYRLGERSAFKQYAPAALKKSVINREAPAEVGSVNFALFWDVWQRLHRYYIDAASIDTQKLVWGAITGMVGALDDPYTTFLPPKENQDFKDEIGGSFQGIGAQLGLKQNRIIVVAPLKSSPAEKSGIKPADWIMKVNGDDTFGWTVEQAVNKIRGPKGTTVTLSILHEKAAKAVDITITRDEIIMPSVEAWAKTPGEITEISGLVDGLKGSTSRVAYLRLSRFGDRTNEEWEKAVQETVMTVKKNGGLKGLIFDLRNNPGGYLDGSVFIASEFLKDGVVVSQVNSDGSKEDYRVNRKGQLLDVPMVVLVNKGSASAAEIVAGALKDHKRAKIIGETTFGKGSVQTPQELEGGSSLHVTTGKWVLPNGDWIHKKGIVPDIEVAPFENGEATRDAQLARAIEELFK